jgi:transposase-like protein
VQDLRTRAVKQIDLVVTDGPAGLLAALSALFGATARQRCLVHTQRNVRSSIPKRGQHEVQADVTGIWKQETQAQALLTLDAFQATSQKRSPEAVRSLMDDDAHVPTFDDFPTVMHRSICTTNAIESFFRNVGSRTDQIDALTTETSCLTIVWAVMQDSTLPKSPVG